MTAHVPRSPNCSVSILQKQTLGFGYAKADVSEQDGRPRTSRFQHGSRPDLGKPEAALSETQKESNEATRKIGLAIVLYALAREAMRLAAHWRRFSKKSPKECPKSAPLAIASVGGNGLSQTGELCVLNLRRNRNDLVGDYGRIWRL
jgi:hypothetical protein